eukprot:4998097-Prorocentrum_lima.AAC.1
MQSSERQPSLVDLKGTPTAVKTASKTASKQASKLADRLCNRSRGQRDSRISADAAADAGSSVPLRHFTKTSAPGDVLPFTRELTISWSHTRRHGGEHAPLGTSAKSIAGLAEARQSLRRTLLSWGCRS